MKERDYMEEAIFDQSLDLRGCAGLTSLPEGLSEIIE